MKSLFVYTSFPSHTFPASIAKILGQCAVAMFSGMLRLHLCDGAVASHRAQVMFASAYAHANRHEECAMASDQTKKNRWSIAAPHQTSMVVAMHDNLGRFVPVGLLLGAWQCRLCFGGLALVVSMWLFPAQHSWIHVRLNEHIAMITPVRDGTVVGDVSSPSTAMWHVFVRQSMRSCGAVLFCMRGSGRDVVVHVSVMDSCKYAKHIAMAMLVQPCIDIGDGSSLHCRCGGFFFTKTTHKGTLLFIIPCAFWGLGYCDCGRD